ncbi:helix-turn-helix domain-containing protein [Candidatus Aenigmatarchaeota archaeon]
MKSMRRGREFYSQHYEEAMKLYKNGVSIKDIATKLKISYSCVYHWAKGIRKPEEGNIVSFVNFLEKSGPTAIIDIKKKFPKHNELYLVSTRRNMKVKRHVLKRKYGDYNTWYYIEGQEELLKRRLEELFQKYKEAKEKIAEALSGIFVK